MNDLFPVAEIIRPGELSDDEFLAQAEGRIRGYGKLVISGIVEIGRELVAVKGRVGHGRYEDFVRKRLRWDPATAWRYTQVSDLFKSFTVQDLEGLNISVTSLHLLAAPSTPAQVRDVALEQAATPKGISRQEVETLIAAAKIEGAETATAGKLVLTADELAESVQHITDEYDAKIKRLTEQRDGAIETAKKLRARKPPEKDDAPELPPIDGTMSFRAALIRRALTALHSELKISAADFVKIEREVAERAHQKSADPVLVQCCYEGRAVIDWLSELLAVCEVTDGTP